MDATTRVQNLKLWADEAVAQRCAMAVDPENAAKVADALARVLAVAEAAVVVCNTSGSAWVMAHGPLERAVARLRGVRDAD